MPQVTPYYKVFSTFRQHTSGHMSSEKFRYHIELLADCLRNHFMEGDAKTEYTTKEGNQYDIWEGKVLVSYDKDARPKITLEQIRTFASGFWFGLTTEK